MIQSISTDFLIRLKNGSLAGRKTISSHASKFCQSLAQLIKKHGYIQDFTITDGPKPAMSITLAYDNGQPRINQVRLVSRPGRRIYEKSFSLPWGQSPDALIIVSTSSGVMSQKQAKKKGLGGEIIAEIY